VAQASVLSLAATVGFLFSIGAAQTVGSTQQRGKSKATTQSIRVNVEMVLVNVGVSDPGDQPVVNLQKDNFRLFEDKVEQEIISFSHEDAPASIGIIFDTSGSMRDKIDRSREAALQILKTANSQDEFFLITFSEIAELRSAFTSDIEALESRLMSIKPRGATALLDAIHLAMQQMKKARYRRCALVIVSDGGNNSSWHTENRIRRDLKEADCQLYAMGIFDRRDMLLTVEEHNGPKLLSALAEITGGRAFSVSSMEELPDIAAKIGMELRDQYVLGYKPGGSLHDGTWRGIKVTVKPSFGTPPVHVYARSGYYRPAY